MPELRSSESTEMVYRPISNWAIGGFLISTGFTIAVLVSAGTAFFMRAPLFFREWTILWPIAGVLLSWIALGKIRDSEGTRAGAKLAHLGLWLGLLSGLTYFSYYYALRLAHIHQANQYLMGDSKDAGFFDQLKKADNDSDRLNEAFFLTISPARRSTFDPKLSRKDREFLMAQTYDQSDKNGAPGELTVFRTNYLVRAIARGGEQSKVTPASVQSWDYGSTSEPGVGGYKVVRVYHVSTPEFEDDVEFPVESFEAESAGQKRKWYVNLRSAKYVNASGTPTYTELGKGVAQLRASAFRFLQGTWVEALNQGKAWPEYELATKTNWALIIPEPKEHRDKLEKIVRARFVLGLPIRSTIQFDAEELPAQWGIENGHFWLRLSFEMSLGGERDLGIPPYVLNGSMKVKLNERDVDPTTFAGRERGTDWTIESIEFVRGRLNRPSQ